MEYAVPRRGAAIVSAWFAALGALVSLPFWRGAFAPTLAALLVWFFLCFGALAARLASCVLRVGAHHLTLRRGLLFPVTRRVPLRFITGSAILQTPLQRLTGTCLFVLYAGGCTTVMAGARRADAEALCARLNYGGRIH